MRRWLRPWLPLIYTRTSLRWSDLEDMPKGELLDLLEFLRG
jgi:hypothetical protein